MIYLFIVVCNYCVAVSHRAQAFYNGIIMTCAAAAAVGVITLLHKQTSCVVSTPAAASDNVMCRRVKKNLPQSLLRAQWLLHCTYMQPHIPVNVIKADCIPIYELATVDRYASACCDLDL